MGIIKTIGQTLALTLKRLYDIFATYLLFWVSYLAAVAVALHFAFEALWSHLGVANAELVWTEIAAQLPLSVGATKLAIFAALHVVVFVIVRRPIAWVQPAVEKFFDTTGDFFDRLTSERWSLRLFGESVFTVTVSALLVPFVIQPTLVHGWDREAWIERGGNLVSGRAVLDLPDSVVGYYNRFGASAVVADKGVSAAQLREAFAEVDADELETPATIVARVGPAISGAETASLDEREWGGAPPQREAMRVAVSPVRQPVMDRWDDHILDATSHDEELFAYVKAFMYVESAGRQYAVSRTGCSGLMQFCAGTARSQPYREVFGTGKVYACGCRGASCAVPRDVQVALESGDPTQVDAQKERFPCEITDARFDPERAIGAGTLYVKSLHRAFDGNVYLMYIGYNSGPGVARGVLRALDNDPSAGIDEIEVHLADALRPYYGSGSAARARSLTRVHLPKIQRALERYGGPSSSEMLNGPEAAATAVLDVDAQSYKSVGITSSLLVPNSRNNIVPPETQ